MDLQISKINLSAVSIASLQPYQRKAFLESLTHEEAQALWYTWEFWARPEQLAPAGSWYTWLILAGRGWGKTRSGVEYVRGKVERGEWRRVALVASTAADARDVIVEGESGFLATAPPNFRPVYEPSKRRLTWPNGAIATTYSAEKPDTLRGPQHDGALADELAKWRYEEAWDQLLLGLRLGEDPRVVVMTTPRPTKIIKDLFKDSTTAVSGGSTYQNVANLAPAFTRKIISKYQGTRLGRQELYAEILGDNPGALWTRDTLEENRVTRIPEMKRIVVAIDPAATSGEDADDTGIVVAGLGRDGHGYVLDDLSVHVSPNEWAKQAISAYHKYQADRIVAEINNGGEMVETTIRTVERHIPYRALHASRGKQTRAEPVAALYEQHRVHHLGMFSQLEDQLCEWVPGEAESPDRLDALVWAITELMLPGHSGKAADLI